MNVVPHQSLRPIQVKFAAVLLVLSAALQVVDEPIRDHSHDTASKVVFWAVSAGLLVLFALAFLHGKGWARWVFLIAVAVGLATSADYFRRASTFSAVYFFVQALIQVSAIVLVFLRPSHEWFRQQKAAR